MKGEDGARSERAFHTRTFERIDVERREAILAVAVAEFAEKGFNGTSVNGLARKAGVSIGSLYSYFPSKDDLFLTVVEKGHDLLVKALSEVDESRGFFEVYRELLTKARLYALSNPELNLVYLDASTQGLRHLSQRLSGSLESATADLYRRALAAARDRGEIRADADLGAAAFCLDNMLLLYQFSFASDYHRERLRIFLGDAAGSGGPAGAEGPEGAERLADSILDFARRALRP